MKLRLYFILVLLFTFFTSFSQTTGCTNSLACNYNPTATISDNSSCYYFFYQNNSVSTGSIIEVGLSE